MIVITWFFLLRSDESVGSETSSGLSRNDFEFDVFKKRVTLTLDVTKTNHKGVTCTRVLECVCAHGEPTADGGVPDYYRAARPQHAHRHHGEDVR